MRNQIPFSLYRHFYISKKCRNFYKYNQGNTTDTPFPLSPLSKTASPNFYTGQREENPEFQKENISHYLDNKHSALQFSKDGQEAQIPRSLSIPTSLPLLWGLDCKGIKKKKTILQKTLIMHCLLESVKFSWGVRTKKSTFAVSLTFYFIYQTKEGKSNPHIDSIKFLTPAKHNPHPKYKSGEIFREREKKAIAVQVEWNQTNLFFWVTLNNNCIVCCVMWNALPCLSSFSVFNNERTPFSFLFKATQSNFRIFWRYALVSPSTIN